MKHTATSGMDTFQMTSGSYIRTKQRPLLSGVCCLVVCALLLSSGCVSRTAFFDPKPAGTPIFRDVPKETAKSSLPFYFLEPPDIINVEAIHLAPRAPYRLRVFDIVMIDVIGTPVEDPISNFFMIEPGGTVNLGSVYGSVRIAGLSVEEAQEAITRHLDGTDGNMMGQLLIGPVVTVRLHRMGDMQQIAGNHTIGPDGFITLGSYGRVYVSGLTVDEARDAIEFHLSRHLDHPVVAVDVFAYNSKAYYVIFQSSALGERVLKFPFTGNETVLDAIANTDGLMPNSSRRIWIARPAGNSNKPVILPVDWVDITAFGKPDTNYQLLPGDRVFVQEDRFLAADGTLARVFAPFERVMGFSLLGVSTATRFSGNVLRGGGMRGAYGGNW
jgi:polysaccharide export outer membrane protein